LSIKGTMEFMKKKKTKKRTKKDEFPTDKDMKIFVGIYGGLFLGCLGTLFIGIMIQ